MTCRAMNCRHEFCWICFGDWRTHRDSYSCNRFDDQNKGMPIENPTALERQKARETIDRYLHYFSRYKNHQLSSELEQKVSFGSYFRIFLLTKSVLVFISYTNEFLN